MILRFPFPSSVSTIVLIMIMMIIGMAITKTNAQQQPPWVVRKSPWAIDNIWWKCNFELDACHFRNQHNLAQFNRYYNPRDALHGKHGLMLLNLRWPRVQRFPGARLISHYFPASSRQGCLFINYFSTSDGPTSFYVIQQDKENSCIFADDDVRRRANRWNEIELQLDLTNGDPRFFLEVRYDKGNYGHFAIGKFDYGIGQCRSPEVNRCV